MSSNEEREPYVSEPAETDTMWALPGATKGMTAKTTTATGSPTFAQETRVKLVALRNSHHHENHDAHDAGGRDAMDGA